MNRREAAEKAFLGMVAAAGVLALEPNGDGQCVCVLELAKPCPGLRVDVLDETRRRFGTIKFGAGQTRGSMSLAWPGPDPIFRFSGFNDGDLVLRSIEVRAWRRIA